MKNYLDEDANGAIVDPAASVNEFMVSFFQDVEKAKAATQRIKDSKVAIDNLKDEARSAVGGDEEAIVSERLSELIVQTNKDAALAKRILENLKKETAKLPKSARGDVRVRDNVVATCLQNLVAAVRSNQQAQSGFKLSLQNKQKDQIKAVKPEVSEEEMKQVLQQGDVGAVVREALLAPQGQDPIAQAYLHAQDKLEDVLKLERSIEELHQMFLDLAVLVEHQGELLDNIEAQVVTAKDYLAQGNNELKKALRHKKQSRRRMCCFIVCVVVLFLVILGPVLGYFTG